MRNARPQPTVDQFLGFSDEELGVDPVVVNLVVAKGIPALADLDIDHYVRLADQWAAHRRMPAMENQFRRTPNDWGDDIDFFRLGLVCWYCDVVLGVAYREDQRNARRIRYTDPDRPVPQRRDGHAAGDLRATWPCCTSSWAVASACRFIWPVYGRIFRHFSIVIG